MIENKNALTILKIFINQSRNEFSQKNIIISTKLARMTVKHWLEFLVKQNMLTTRKLGVNKLFKLNSSNSIVKQIKILNTLDQIRYILVKLEEKYNFEAYLYGSCARGEDEEESDVDILVIGTVNKSKIISEINRLSAKIKRKVKLNIFTKAEWSMASRKDEAFYERVQADKIEIR